MENAPSAVNTATLGLNEHLIDCDANPIIPKGWSIQEEDQLPHRVKGHLKWDPAKVNLLLHPEQKKGVISGHEIRGWLVDKPVYRANVLDYLRTNPHIIPNEWKPKEGEVKFIFFWGDIYLDSDRLLFASQSYKSYEYRNAVEMAISFAEHALANIKLFPDDEPGKQEWLWRVEHTNFYHKASLPDLSESKAALDFALTRLPSIVEQFRQSNSSDWYYAKESQCWILVRFGNDEQLEQAKTEVQEMLDNHDIPPEFRRAIRENYEKIGIFFRNNA